MKIELGVQQLYVGFFGRPADPAGLRFWTDMVSSGRLTLAQIAREFAVNPEARLTVDPAVPVTPIIDTLESYVSTLYPKLFGRPAEPGGAYFWARLVADGKMELAALPLALAEAASGADKVALDAKLTAAQAFTDWYAATPGQSQLLGPGSASATQFMLHSVVDAPSLATFVAEFKKSGSSLPPATPYTLTVSDTAIREGDTGTATAFVTVKLDKPATTDVRFKFETVNGSAVAGSDYMASSGDVVFKAGQSVATLLIAVVGDKAPESQEAFSVRFSGPGIVQEASATIFVHDFDNSSPVFTSSPTVRIAENQGRYAIIDRANAVDTDPDDGVFYRIKQGVGDFAAVGVNAGTGDIVLRAPANHEAKARYEFTVVATDRRGAQTEQKVTAIVNDDNDLPTIGSPGAISFLSTSTPAGTVLFSANASDQDAHTTLAYALTGRDAALFAVDNAGVVTLKNGVGTQVKSVYQVNLVVSDGVGETVKALPIYSVPAAIEAIYVAFAGIPADVSSFSFWTGWLEKAGNLKLFEGALAQSTLLQSLSTDINGVALDPFQVVDAVYMRLFGRHADSGGLHFWGEALANKQVSLDQLLIGVIGGAQADDLAAFSAKVDGATRLTQRLIEDSAKLGRPLHADSKTAKWFLQGPMDDAALDALISFYGTDFIVAPFLGYEIYSSSKVVTEGVFGREKVAVTFTLDQPALADFSVKFSTQDVSAKAGDDYVAMDGILKFAKGQLGATISFDILHDRIPELTESFAINLSGDRLAVPHSAVVVIRDNLRDSFGEEWIAGPAEPVLPGQGDAIPLVGVVLPAGPLF